MIDYQFFTIHGNAPLKSAEVICMIDAPSAQESNASLIHHIWDNHIVLIGGAPKNQRVKPEDCSIGLNRIQDIRGWDIPESSELSEKFNNIYLKICQLEKKLLVNILYKKWKSFFNPDSALKELLNLAFPDAGLQEVERKCALELLEREDYEKFSSRIKALIKRAKVLYVQQCSKVRQDIFQQRNESLLRSIMETSDQGRNKLIVLMENEHLLQLDHFPKLKSQKFVVICSKTVSSPFQEDMIHLWPKRENERVAEVPQLSPALELHEQLKRISPSKDTSIRKTKTFQDLICLLENNVDLK